MRIAISILLILISSQLISQELNCRVQVLARKIQGTDKRVFTTMQTAINEFMNNTKWTEDEFKNEERIECSLHINITERQGTDKFKATIQVQVRRPIYKTSYSSVLFNYSDKDFNFTYLEYDPIELYSNSFGNNLSSVLAYYAYVILAMDYDSFALNGGTAYFERARQIVTYAQNAQEKGWKAFEGRKNRYWLVENILNDLFSPIRKCNYAYHRKGLDIMHDEVEEGRAAIFKGLELLKMLHRTQPNSFNMQLFFNAKVDELVNIYSKAYDNEKKQVVLLLSGINPSNVGKYNKILKPK